MNTAFALDSAAGQSGVTIIYENRPGVNVEIIFDDANDSLGFRFEEPPEEIPDWA